MRASSRDRAERIRQLHAEGRATSEIAASVGITTKSIREWMQKLGLTGHARVYASPTPPIERILSRLQRRGDGCWVWNGTIRRGIALLPISGGSKIAVARALWDDLVGDVPPMLVRTCHEARCVRPSHHQRGRGSRP